MDAYSNGTLRHMDCTACAVGNLIRGNGYEFKGDLNVHWNEQEESCYDYNSSWLNHIMRERRGFADTTYVKPQSVEAAIEQIESTGYSIEELDKIEHAFEICKKLPHSSEKELQFLGLTAVLKVLEEIHQGEEPKSQQRLEKIAKDKYLVEV